MNGSRHERRHSSFAWLNCIYVQCGAVDDEDDGDGHPPSVSYFKLNFLVAFLLPSHSFELCTERVGMITKDVLIGMLKYNSYNKIFTLCDVLQEG